MNRIIIVPATNGFVVETYHSETDTTLTVAANPKELVVLIGALLVEKPRSKKPMPVVEDVDDEDDTEHENL